MVISLDQKLESALNAAAKRQGVPPELLAVEAIRERYLAPTQVDEMGDEWVRRLRSIASDCGVSLSDAAVSSEGIYE